MGASFSLRKANLDEFYKKRFKIRSGKYKRGLSRKSKILKFLNFFTHKVPYRMKVHHNKYHIIRYLQFIKGIKNFVTGAFELGFVKGSYGFIVTDYFSSKNSNNIIDRIRAKVHKNKVEKLLIGDENDSPVTSYFT